MTRLCVLLLTLVFCPVAVFAQCPTNEVATLGTVPANAPIRLAWEYPSQSAINYSVLVDGQIVKNFVTADLTVTATSGFPNCQSISATIPGLAAKQTPYRIKLRAYVGSDPTAAGFVETAEKDLRVGLTVPFNFRVVVTPVIALNKLVGVDVSLHDGDSTVAIVKEFVPVADYTGRITLRSQSVIQK